MRIIFIVLILLCSTALSEKRDGHNGHSIFYGNSYCKDFFYKIYDHKIEDSKVKKEKEYVVNKLNEIKGTEYTVDDLYLSQSAKFIGHKTIYIHQYVRTSQGGYYLLVDECNDLMLFLEEFSYKEFNEFFEKVSLELPKNEYVFLSKLYLVLGNIDNWLYFLDSSFDFGTIAFFEKSPFPKGIDPESEFIDLISEPTIINSQNRVIYKSDVYIKPDNKVYRYSFSFNDNQLIDVERVEIINFNDYY